MKTPSTKGAMPKIILAHEDDLSSNYLRLLLEPRFQVEVATAPAIVDTPPDLFLVDHRLDHGNGIHRAEELLKKFPSIPVALVAPFGLSRFKKLVPYSQLKIVNSALDPEDFISAIATVAGLEPTPQKNEYSRVNILTLTALNPLPCDVYLEVAADHQVKMFSSGDIFLEVDQKRYSDKGVHYFYVKSENLPLIFATYANILNQHLDQTTLGESRIFTLNTATLELIKNAYQDFNIDPKQQLLIVNILKSTVDGLLNNPLIEPLFFTKWINDKNYVAAHSVALAHLSLSIYLQFHAIIKREPDPIATTALAQAALLHDLFIENETMARAAGFDEIAILVEKYSAQEIQDFLVNPERAATIARSLPQAPDLTAKILSQHRELPSGEGFPARLTPTQTHPLAALLILAHSYLNHLLEKPSHDPKTFIDRHFKEFFIPVYRDWLAVLRKSLIG